MNTCAGCDDGTHVECDDCERPMISKQRVRVHGDRRPGHVTAQARGMCESCYNRWRDRQRVVASAAWRGGAA